jgi:hypothetical protein
MSSNPQQPSVFLPPSHLVWYLIFDSITGKPYKGTSADKVSVPSPSADVADFRDSVHLKSSSILIGIISSQLLVYKTKAAFDKRNAHADDEKEYPLEEDSLISGLGASKQEALVVVVPSSSGSSFRGDKMEVDLIPASSALPALFNTKIDGLYLGNEHLKRSELVGKLQWLVSKKSIVLLNSPAGSGKSSLFTLFQAATRYVEVVYISLSDKRNPFAILSEAGIDLQGMKISDHLVNKSFVFFLDDAQNKYGDTYFWESFIKIAAIWMPGNIKFIISATHLLSGGKESPVEFVSLPRLSRTDFLLTDEEAYQLLELRASGLPVNIREHKILKDVLVKECGGLVGALRLSIDALEREFFAFKNDNVEEALCLEYFLSDKLVQNMARCFGNDHSRPTGNDFKTFLKGCFENQKIWRDGGFTNSQDDNSYFSLKKAGILVELPDSSFGFSSPLAKRYYFKWIFPNRSQTTPSSLRELIIKVVSNMSSTVLKKSTLPGDFPKEAVFQHLFMEGLALHTPPHCAICPELSKIFPSDLYRNNQQAPIADEIDFYLNGSLRWGIELLVNGDGVGEHLGRFSPPNGKYVSLAVNDFAVVDFRRNATGQPTHPHRVSVFFKNDDYSVAQCLFGEDTSPTKIILTH